GDLKATAEQRQLWPAQVLFYASQGGTDGERYQQEEGDGEHNRQREDTLPEPAPEVGPHAVDGFGLDFPDEVQSRLQLTEDRCSTDGQSHEANNGRQCTPLRLSGGEDGVHQLSASPAHEQLDLLLELVSDVLLIR